MVIVGLPRHGGDDLLAWLKRKALKKNFSLTSLRLPGDVTTQQAYERAIDYFAAKVYSEVAAIAGSDRPALYVLWL